ncbi:hypothetical protein FG87_13660 [Nocardia vulneris]|uniref:Uncharacterized protein n=1 Tax=Nocardia vulneris TaxID=1141657 RepID=A0ABR4ZH32_9NOCA|nr:hypothetical protein FG87_13660 [Nocardia vulneris]
MTNARPKPGPTCTELAGAETESAELCTAPPGPRTETTTDPCTTGQRPGDTRTGPAVDTELAGAGTESAEWCAAPPGTCSETAAGRKPGDSCGLWGDTELDGPGASIGGSCAESDGTATWLVGICTALGGTESGRAGTCAAVGDTWTGPVDTATEPVEPCPRSEGVDEGAGLASTWSGDTWTRLGHANAPTGGTCAEFGGSCEAFGGTAIRLAASGTGSASA